MRATGIYLKFIPTQIINYVNGKSCFQFWAAFKKTYM